MKARANLIAALSLTTLTATGCYVVPASVGPDGQPIYAAYPVGVPPYPVAPVPPAPGTMPPQGGALPVVLHARLYPDNDIATQTGVVTGTVTNMMNGKGRFQLQYGSEILTGEATRVSGDERRGIASAFGSSGSYMSCEYQMNTPRQGAGTCMFSNGARYKVHIGS